MKIIVHSDLHFDKTTFDEPRFDDVLQSVNQVERAAIDNEADVVICTGDIADPDSGGVTFAAIAAIQRLGISLTTHGIKFIVITGNHDVVEDGSGYTVLTPLRPLAQYHEGFFVVEQPMLVWLTTKLGVMCLPFTSVAASYSPEVEASRMMNLSGRANIIVAAHLSVPGVLLGEETTDMPRGRDVLFPFDATKGAVMRINGHYHRRQVFDPKDGGPPIYIPGAPQRFTFNDENNEPGFLMIDMED